jgi:hypothetical protein
MPHSLFFGVVRGYLCYKPLMYRGRVGGKLYQGRGQRCGENQTGQRVGKDIQKE